MKIAVAYENGEVFQHFGHTKQFKFYDVRGGKVVDSMVIEALDCGHEAMAGFLSQLKVSALICGGIGGGARAALEEAGIILYGGVTGGADAAVSALIAGNLSYDPDIHCHYHENAGHGCSGCSHSCNGQDCGSCHES